ncbi:LRR receptor-like kinase family protein [Melia azedarach]|uniref:LRR receptor-like kinase family protein n=1 Tax=Melia azedarach TaxID=155640 RepID=A0ACC1X378_MELAZ|nr:LRR receptor-like kinase family protein [Melia azedarach]
MQEILNFAASHFQIDVQGEESAQTEVPADGNTPEDEDQLITLGFYVSLIVGFIAGFWGVCGTLLLNSSWRYAYLNFWTGVKDWLFVKAAVSIAKRH